MSQDKIEVKHAGMAAGSEALTAEATGLNDIMTQLESSLHKALGGNWEGQAKAGYQQTKAKWDENVAELTEFLRRLGGMVGEINDGWGDVDNRGAKFWA
ncbi:MAG: WXG100 family type VII secretion target [Propionicimonas sp.]